MATAPPSTRTKSPVPAPGQRSTPDARGPAADVRSRRRLPVIVWALVGALAAGAYGTLVLSMRFGPPLVMVGLGGLTLVLGAAALWRIVDPLTRSDVALPPDARAPHRVRELEREKQAVLKAIKEIELDHQMRKISDGDYREMVERYRARALRIMGDLAVGDDYRALIERELKDRVSVRVAAGSNPARASGAETGIDTRARPATKSSAAATDAGIAPSTTACVSCATVNDSDAQFCKRCGQRLNSPAVPG